MVSNEKDVKRKQSPDSVEFEENVLKKHNFSEMEDFKIDIIIYNKLSQFYDVYENNLPIKIDRIML